MAVDPETNDIPSVEKGGLQYHEEAKVSPPASDHIHVGAGAEAPM